MNYIYILKHPITKEIRYVGKTNDPVTRRYNHIKLINSTKTYSKSWIKSLLEQGLKPELEVIEECTTNWAEREQYWIKYYLSQEVKLTNHSLGGECGLKSIEHINKREQQVLKAIELINTGIEIKEAEKQCSLPNGYLSKVRNKKIAFLEHINVPYFRKLSRL